MPLAMGVIIDRGCIDLGVMTLNGVSAAFFLPFLSFVAIAVFGYRTVTIHAVPPEQWEEPRESVSEARSSEVELRPELALTQDEMRSRGSAAVAHDA